MRGNRPMMAHGTASRLLPAVVVGVILLATARAGADVDADKRACANEKLDVETRLAACSRLLAAEGISKTDRAWALVQRGSLYRRMKEYDKALADLAEAETCDPGNPETHRARGHIQFKREQYAEAEAEFTRALKLDPRHPWSWYARGLARVNQGKFDEALKDYDKALSLDPRYLSAYSARARLHIRREDYQQAIRDCDGALSLDPYHADAYAARAMAYERTGKHEAAMHGHAVAFSLNPRLGDSERDLKRLAAPAIKSVSERPAEPIAYQPPRADLSISYLQTVRPKQAAKDEMEDAIGALAAWFKGKPVPMPKYRLFLVRRVTGAIGNTTTIAPAHKYPSIDRKEPPVTKVDYYRSLWPTVFPMGDTGQVLTIELEQAALDALWPLEVGRKGAGGAQLVYVAPDPLPPQARFFGCKKPGDRIPFGQINWTGGVVAREKVVVPAGVFDAAVIRFDEEMELRMGGMTRKQGSVVTWWYAPAVRWWVKRTREVETETYVDEAETVK